MNILYIHQYFRTPHEAGGTRSYWICQELIKNGHKVTMLATSKTVKKNIEKINVDGIDVIYLKVHYSQMMSVFRRLLSFVNFMVKSTLIALKENRVDLVISTSTPLTVGFPALVLKKLKKIPFVFEVRDLWPEVPIQMGGLKNKISIKLALWFEKSIYNNATHIITLSPGMQDGVVARNIPKDKTSMIPNMSKIEEFWEREKSEKVYKELDISKDTFKAVYFGSMGIANGMDYILDAAKLISKEEKIEFIFLGDGSTRSHLENRCKIENIKNVRFLGNFPMAKLSETINLCDVSLVTFLNLPILATNSPNKLFDSLSAGKSIIVNSAGWTKEMVENHKCGYYVDPESPKKLTEIIRYLKNNPELNKELGRNSRKLAETVYDKSILCMEFVNVVHSLDLKRKV